MIKPLIIISWIDAHDISGWKDESEIIAQPANVTSVGYLVKESDNALCLAQTIAHDEVYNNIIIIPKVNILNKKEI